MTKKRIIQKVIIKLLMEIPFDGNDNFKTPVQIHEIHIHYLVFDTLIHTNHVCVDVSIKILNLRKLCLISSLCALCTNHWR